MQTNIIATIITASLCTMILITIFFLALAFKLDSIEDKFDPATIGGTNVPAIHCQEDEVISWTGIDTLGCVHFEEVD